MLAVAEHSATKIPTLNVAKGATFGMGHPETRQVIANYHTTDKSNALPIVEVEGWNVNHTIAKARQ